MREIQGSGPADFAVTLAAAHFRHPSRRPACQANSVGGCSRTTMAARDKGSDWRSVARATRWPNVVTSQPGSIGLDRGAVGSLPYRQWIVPRRKSCASALRRTLEPPT